MKTILKKIISLFLANAFLLVWAIPVSALSTSYNSNLVSGKSYTLSAYDSAHPEYSWTLGMADTGKSELTNGLNGSPTDYTDAAWTGYNGWKNTTTTTIAFDLQTIKAIKSVKSSFFKVQTAGIAPPLQVKVELSSDNTNWTTVAAEGISATMENISFPQAYQSRYVRIKFVHGNSWLIFDEIQVFGSDSIVDAVAPVAVPDLSANLVRNSAYTFTAFDFLYPNYAWSLGMADTGKSELTNGLTGNPTDYSDAAWTGYNGWMSTTVSTVAFDLQAVKAVKCIISDFFTVEKAGIAPPSKVTVSLSTNGTTWTVVAIERLRDKMKQINFAQAYNARYVKIDYQHGNSWLIFDEVQVFGSSDSTLGTSPTEFVEPAYNIAARRPYTFTAFDPFFPETNYIQSGYYKEDTGGKELTNEIWCSSSDFNDARWCGYYGWKNTTTSTIFFDFSTIQAINEVTIGYLVNATAGIGLPLKVKILLSSDNKNWTSVYEENPVTPEAISPYQYTYTLSQSMKARYVKIEMIHGNTCLFLDEIEVIGSNTLGQAVDPILYVPEPTPPPVEQPDPPRNSGSTEQRFPNGSNALSGYMKSGTNSSGIHDLVLLYNQYYEDGTGDYTAEKIRPYLTYLNREGKAVDTMFDGVLFLGLNSNRFTQVGDVVVWRSFSDQRYPAEKVDFEWYLNKTFAANGDMAALNEAAAIAGTELGNSNYKAKVVLTVPCPSPRLTSFGEFGSMSVVTNRIAALKWYMNQLYSRFQAGNYTHVQLSGLYWLDESMETNDQVVRTFTDFTHTKGLKAFWIPFYDASGATSGEWKNAGMDTVAYQPNHYFTATADPSRITSAAQQASNAGMGIEIEVGPDVMKTWDSFDRACDYLDGSVLYNYQGQNAFRAYYQWVTGYQRMAFPTLQNAAYVPGTLQYERGRRHYEDTYKMIKGTLKLSNRTLPQPPTVQTVTASTIQLKSLSGYEYSIDFIHWSSSPTFTGLTASKKHSLYQRIAATSSHEASLSSDPVQVSTLN